MAVLILGKTQCELCAGVIDAEHAVVSAPHFIHDSSHPLWRYSDASMHRDCFQRWPCRDEFVAFYNRTIGEMVWGNGTRHRMREDGAIDCVDA